MTVAEFDAFCQRHRIRFEYHQGERTELQTRSFAIPSTLRLPSSDSGPFTDLRPWFEVQGVTFPQKTSAKWQPSRRRLLVRNTEENIELIAAIIKSKSGL
jgi:hypothetical protein